MHQAEEKDLKRGSQKTRHYTLIQLNAGNSGHRWPVVVWRLADGYWHSSRLELLRHRCTMLWRSGSAKNQPQMPENFTKRQLWLPCWRSCHLMKHNSTETAVLRSCQIMLTAMDNQQVTLLVLLDLSAAFDFVDHDILLSRLQSGFSLGGITLTWIRSFLTDRS